MAKPIKIVIAGEGGQGVQAIADILAESAFREGYESLYIPNFGIEQRGGVSMAFVQVSENRIGSPKFRRGDIVAALSNRALVRLRQYVAEGTFILFDSSIMAVPEVEDAVVGLQSYDTIAPESFAERVSSRERKQETYLTRGNFRIIGIPAADIARKELHPRVFNMIILGALLLLSDISEEEAKKTIESKLGHKFENQPELRDLNFQALDRGRGLILQEGVV